MLFNVACLMLMRLFRVNSWPARQQTLKRSQAVDSDSVSTQGLGKADFFASDDAFVQVQ